MSSTPVSNSFLADRSARIGSKAIPWEVRSLSLPLSPSQGTDVCLSRPQGYQRAGLLNADDVALIQRVAGQKAQADAILEAVSPLRLPLAWTLD